VDADDGDNRPPATEVELSELQQAEAQRVEPQGAEPEPSQIALSEPRSDDLPGSTAGTAANEDKRRDAREGPSGELPAIEPEADPATEPESSIAEQVSLNEPGAVDDLEGAHTEIGDADAAADAAGLDAVDVDASAPENAGDADVGMEGSSEDASVGSLVEQGDAQPVADVGAPAEIAHHHETDGAGGEEASVPIVVRTGWASPPPLTTRPSWVVRDIEPDIVPSERVADAESSTSAFGALEPPPAPVEGAQDSESEVDRAAQPVADTLPQREAEPAIDAEQVADYDAQLDADVSGWRQERARAAGVNAPTSGGLGEPSEADAPAPSDAIATEAHHSQPEVGGDLPPPLPSQSVAGQARLRDAEIAPADAEAQPGRDDSTPSLEALTPPLLPRQAAAPVAPRVYDRWPSPNLQQSMHAQASSAVSADYDDDVGADDSRWDRAKTYARTALRYAGYGIAGYFAFVFVLILLYRVINPPFSSLMAVQAVTGTDVHQEWVALEDISPALVRAVIVSEDWSFCEHYGIDIKAIEQAIERSGNGIPRGASTISMQTTKNLFLWNAKSYVRKAVEVPLTLMIELIWPKWRILEIYLNVAEWGPGVFGAEAAAQYHFNKPASQLGEREAAQLAASLPNPIIREAGDPGPRTARKASVIQSRMRNAAGAATCVLGKR
jgi:monofunctional biosynthetic peptidoglycan transglycosylase